MLCSFYHVLSRYSTSCARIYEPLLTYRSKSGPQSWAKEVEKKQMLSIFSHNGTLRKLCASSQSHRFIGCELGRVTTCDIWATTLVLARGCMVTVTTVQRCRVMQEGPTYTTHVRVEHVK